jgi:hypothetical protein
MSETSRPNVGAFPFIRACPFCAGSAKVYPDNEGFSAIGCIADGCGAAIGGEWIGTAPIEGALLASLVTRWNRRPTRRRKPWRCPYCERLDQPCMIGDPRKCREDYENGLPLRPPAPNPLDSPS